MIAITSISSNDWIHWRDMRLRALEDAPQAFCSSLRDWQGKDEPTWRRQLVEVSLNLIATVDGTDAGMVSAMACEGEVELLSMWVAPRARGRGVGDALVDSVVAWTKSQGTTRLILRILDGNVRAETLYARHGFEYEHPGQDTEKSVASPERLMVRTSL
jgi:GNAT superfamily N-acetyltransferase